MSYRLGNATFKTKEAKERWILEGILFALLYIGKESKLSHTEKELLKLAKRKLKVLINKRQG